MGLSWVGLVLRLARRMGITIYQATLIYQSGGYSLRWVKSLTPISKMRLRELWLTGLRITWSLKLPTLKRYRLRVSFTRSWMNTFLIYHGPRSKA